jgi:hypothetical protein
MRKISLFGIAITMTLAGIAAWTSSSHSAVKAAIGPAQIDPFSIMGERKEFAQSGVAQFEDVAR